MKRNELQPEAITWMNPKHYSFTRITRLREEYLLLDSTYKKFYNRATLTSSVTKVIMTVI